MYHDNRVTLFTTPCYITCIMITVVGSLLITPSYLTFTMITDVGSLFTTPCYLTCYRGRLSAHHTLLPNMYHDNRSWLSAHHTLLSNMYHDNKGYALGSPCYLTCSMVIKVDLVFFTLLVLRCSLFQYLFASRTPYYFLLQCLTSSRML